MIYIFKTIDTIPCPICNKRMFTNIGALEYDGKYFYRDYRIFLECMNNECQFNNLSNELVNVCSNGHCRMYFSDLKLWSFKLFSEENIKLFEKEFEELINF